MNIVLFNSSRAVKNKTKTKTDVSFRALYYETLLSGSADPIIATVNTLDSVLCPEAC